MDSDTDEYCAICVKSYMHQLLECPGHFYTMYIEELQKLLCLFSFIHGTGEFLTNGKSHKYSS